MATMSYVLPIKSCTYFSLFQLSDGLASDPGGGGGGGKKKTPQGVQHRQKKKKKTPPPGGHKDANESDVTTAVEEPLDFGDDLLRG